MSTDEYINEVIEKLSADLLLRVITSLETGKQDDFDMQVARSICHEQAHREGLHHLIQECTELADLHTGGRFSAELQSKRGIVH
jgi:hypothetical protein